MFIMTRGTKTCGQKEIAGWEIQYRVCMLYSLSPYPLLFPIPQLGMFNPAPEPLAYSQWLAYNFCSGGKNDTKFRLLSISQVKTFVVNKISESVKDAEGQFSPLAELLLSLKVQYSEPTACFQRQMLPQTRGNTLLPISTWKRAEI